ncbi:membrane protein insertase YidC [Sinimarinibacterium sp. CAU 1509]|uniref:membrane protein insertase YidC n=1 Tax=Sinimarinibacterium sp. CAU 1509 TaxID=2562283 RepID=UPI0010ACF402|nr:membrane protein insertase YidC [Sinimarinibacterium sp. CAU 1509]TJY58222.1 membrane protein insertase YidC [Sinimarinibacterium sp. CAU 1509]
MENRRFFLIALIGVVLFFTYQAWQQDYGPQAQPAVSTGAAPATATVADVDVPVATPGQTPAIAPTPDAGLGTAPESRIIVDTDLVTAEISTEGGELRRLALKDYSVTKKNPDEKFALLDDRDGHYFVLQSGLAGTTAQLITHKTRYTATQTEYHMAAGQDQLDVVLSYTDPSGYSARKIYRFTRGSYKIDLIHELDNSSAADIVASPYARLVRTNYQAGGEPRFASTFTGVGFYEQKEGGDGYRYKKTKLDKLNKDAYEANQTGGWIAMLQHYFVAAILPPPDQTASYTAKPTQGQAYMAQYVGQTQTIAAGTQVSFDTPLYLGPKLQDGLDDIVPGFELTLDYGILTPISEPLFWLLSHLHGWTGNWGFAIILLTLLVKVMMYKLSEAQYRSMAKMKKFAPKIQELKERFGDDRERMQKAMMELYKKEGFNPLAGCWPLLVQFPVFISLYWVLLESVELRQASFIFWLNDLTSPDPYYVLPVLFGVSMFIQQKLSGQQVADPTQQKIMQLMPIMLTAFFTFFQSGLVLYWFVSNLIGIAQQWIITRRLESADAAKAAVKR